MRSWSAFQVMEALASQPPVPKVCPPPPLHAWRLTINLTINRSLIGTRASIQPQLQGLADQGCCLLYLTHAFPHMHPPHGDGQHLF